MIYYNELKELAKNTNFYIITQENVIELYEKSPYKIIIPDYSIAHDEVIYVKDIHEVEEIINKNPNKEIYMIVPTSLYSHIAIAFKAITNDISPYLKRLNFCRNQIGDETIYDIPLIFFYHNSGKYIESLSKFHDVKNSEIFNEYYVSSSYLQIYSIDISMLTRKNINYLKLIGVFDDPAYIFSTNNSLKNKDLSIQESYEFKGINNKYYGCPNKHNLNYGHNFLNDFITNMNREFPQDCYDLIL